MTDSINFEQGTPFSWELPKDLSFPTTLENQNDDDRAAFNKHLADKAAAVCGISPELLNSLAATESTKSFTKQWMDLFGNYAQTAKGHLQAAVKDILLRETKVVLTKTLHCNGGSMRKRRSRHCFTRIKTTVVVKETLLNNVIPISIGEIVSHEDSTVSVNVQFKQINPIPPIRMGEVAMRAYRGPDDVLNLVGYDLVDKAQ